MDHHSEIKVWAGPCSCQRLSGGIVLVPSDTPWLVDTSLCSLPLFSFLDGSVSSSLMTLGTYKSLDLSPNRNPG